MSRPIGSKNKPKVKNGGLFVTNLEKQIEGAPKK